MKKSSLLAMTVMAVFIFTAATFAASDSVKVTAKAFPTRVTLGDEITLEIHVERPQGYSVSPPSKKSRLAPFEIKSIETRPVRERFGKIETRFNMILTCFELGDFNISPVLLHFSDLSGHSGEVWTQPVAIKVVEVPKAAGDKEDIRPIKGPVSLDLTGFKNIILLILVILLASVLGGVIYWKQRRKKITDRESLLPPHERASLELERLKQKGLLEEKKIKEFYSELADILRRFLERRYGIVTLELTTIEILNSAKEQNLETSVVDKMKHLLENSDLVKFAKYLPARALADELMSELLNIVRTLSTSGVESG